LNLQYNIDIHFSSLSIRMVVSSFFHHPENNMKTHEENPMKKNILFFDIETEVNSDAASLCSQ